MPFDSKFDQSSSSKTPSSAKASVDRYFERIEDKSELNAYVILMQDEARKRAEESDERLRKGSPLPLDGLPLAVKDNFCTKGTRTTAGSRILEDFTPTYESFVTQQLLNAGAVFLGKTNMDEFGMGSSTEKSHFGPTINPNIREDGVRVVPGGSSGGTAAAVAGKLAAAGIGSDTGGSLRQPAAFCGVVGFKPTYGLCSRWGLIAYASSLDQAGVITEKVKDAAQLTDVIAAADENDSTSLPWPKKVGFEASLMENEAKPYKIGIPKKFRAETISDELENLWEKSIALAKAAGHTVVEVSLPSINYSLPTYYIIALCEASSNLARFDGVRYGHRANDIKDIYELYSKTRYEGFNPEVRKRIMLGTFALSAGYYDEYFGRAMKARRVIFNEFQSAFAEVDFMMWPTAPSSAFPFGHDASDALTMYLEDIFTVPVNLTGSPAISIPICDGNGSLPMGIQLIGPRFSDDELLAAAQSMESAASYVRPCARA
ncbi:MAG: Asp-tRNA(Asn)/Glu-tRNA(Gln) amidotransferase subunit GatA [Pseudomonadota bacterium]